MLLLFLLLLFLRYLTFVSFWGLFDPPYFLLFFFQQSRSVCVCVHGMCEVFGACVRACVCVYVCLSAALLCVTCDWCVCVCRSRARTPRAFFSPHCCPCESEDRSSRMGGVMFRRGQGRGAGRESMIVLSVSRVSVMGLFGDSTIVRSVCFRVLLPRGGWRGGGGPLASPGPVF